jgi:PAS domain S-box-containing protein
MVNQDKATKPGEQNWDLANEKKYYEALIINSPAAIVVINRDSLIREWNPAAEQLFGFSRSEAMGRNIDDLITNEEIRTEAASYSETTKQGDSVQATTWRVRKDGSLVEVEVLGVPIYSDSHEITDFMAIYHDVTELQRARKEALAASQAKSEFLANMSHEIRTPMNGVIGMTSLLLDTTLNTEQREYAETIRKSGDALLSIINDILDFSKIEANKLELESHPFDLRECIESALDLVAYQASEKGLELLYNVGEDVPAVVIGDVTRLRQIIANLLSNAVKFTEKGEVEVSAKLADSRDNSATLRFAVRDTGIGIPPDQTGRLFNLFSQIDASTTRRFGGTGLGLSICKRLVDLMGGEIGVESSGVPGEGTIFYFTLPFNIPKEPIRMRQSSPRLYLSGKTALIVDDNATNRLILARMAASWGMKTIVCSSGRETLEKMAEGIRVDVMLLDVQMPEMDGLTLSAELKQRSGTQIPTVILSSLGSHVEMPKGIQAVYLNKPIKPSSLYEALCLVLSGAEGGCTAKNEGEAGFDKLMSKRHPLRILLAEDHPVNQKVVRLMLERLGYRADVVGNGLEVLESFRRQLYDVVLMDIQMPELNGIQATQRLRTTLSTENQPRIIALTANAIGGEQAEYLAVGMDDYLSKPVNVLQLREALEKCMPVGIESKTDSDGESAPKQANLQNDSATSSASIDIAQLKEYFPYEGEDVKMILDLAEEFLTDTEKRLAALEDAWLREDTNALKEGAHSIKGASLTFGAVPFSQLCKELEIMGKNGNLENVKEKLDEVQIEFTKMRAELLRVLSEMLP